VTIGIIGSGAIGTAFARTLSRAGIEATISNSGFAGIDLGSLEVGGKLAQFPGGPRPNQNH